jgi:ERCC4-type nuclease
VGVEDKPDKEVILDIRNGHLNDQLERMVAAVALPILLIRQTGADIDREALETALLGRQLRGLVVVRTSQKAFGQRIRKLYEYTRSTGRYLPPAYKQHYPWVSPLTKRAEVVYTIMALVPRLRDRVTVAKQLAEAHSVSELLAWRNEEWEATGFSRGKARELADVCHLLAASGHWEEI